VNVAAINARIVGKLPCEVERVDYTIGGSGITNDATQHASHFSRSYHCL
jgi:hypothetical protein